MRYLLLGMHLDIPQIIQTDLAMPVPGQVTDKYDQDHSELS
jgi:hypothetical protein